MNTKGIMQPSEESTIHSYKEVQPEKSIKSFSPQILLKGGRSLTIRNETFSRKCCFKGGYTMRLHRKLAQVLLVCVLLASVAVTTSAYAKSYVVPNLQVDLRQGSYIGQQESGVYIWRGIQFATAPRFQAPGKMPNSNMVINAFTHGKSTSGATGGDIDCLNLAVYVNPIDTGKPKSVFMWLFGSANIGRKPRRVKLDEFCSR